MTRGGILKMLAFCVCRLYIILDNGWYINEGMKSEATDEYGEMMLAAVWLWWWLKYSVWRT
jgi:hypothetical protein